MSAFGNITKKEIKELLTPATILPIIFIALLFGTMGGAISGIEEEIREPPIIGVISEDTGSFATIATSILNDYANVTFNSSDIGDKQHGLDYINQEEGVALIVIRQNFTANILAGSPGEIEVYWLMRGAGILDTVSSTAVEQIIATINTNLSRELIQGNASVNATIVLAPTMRNETTYFKGRELPGLSPGAIAGMLTSQSTFIPIIMMMIIIMAGSLIISSMALEKENKTLETLLTLPVKRVSIVAGKIAASAVIGLLLAAIYMVGMSYYLQSLQMSAGLNLADFNLVLSATDFLLIGVSLFITLIAALSLCMLLGTFAKNYKSAQTLTFPITLLALIPMFIIMFKDFDTLPVALKGLLFAIPFSHPMMAPRALIFGDYLLVIGGIIYVSLFALVTISLAVWVFKTDRLLTGSTRKKKRWLFRRQL